MVARRPTKHPVIGREVMALCAQRLLTAQLVEVQDHDVSDAETHCARQHYFPSRSTELAVVLVPAASSASSAL